VVSFLYLSVVNLTSCYDGPHLLAMAAPADPASASVRIADSFPKKRGRQITDLAPSVLLILPKQVV
jgi:hypothetical protein